MIICPKCESNQINIQNEKVVCDSCTTQYPIIDDIPCFAPSLMYENEGFDSSLFESLYKIENKHFWFRARNKLIYNTIENLRKSSGKKKIDFLEIGCGNGTVLQYISKNKSINACGGDIFLEALTFCKKRVDDYLYQIDVNSLPFVEEFDVIGFFDILEHIDDDFRALNNVCNSLKKGAWIVITVPAHKSLWSNFDVIAKHKRRYSKKELTAKLEKAGFAIERISSFSTIMLPLVLIVRKLFYGIDKDNKRLLADIKPIPLLNSLFYLIMLLETKLINYINLPIGSSILVVAKKVDH